MSVDGPWPARAAVVGTGTMGIGFAQLLAGAGIECRVADLDGAAAARARDRIVEQAHAFASAGLIGVQAVSRIESHVVAASSAPDAVRDTDVVLEAVPEAIELKQHVLAAIEAAAPEECVIATNTSAIPIASLSAGLARPATFLGAHWFNPPQWVPCVELIPGPETERGAVELMSALLIRLGKVPAVVGDGPGFVANRIQFAMFKEAAMIAAEGIATPEMIDEVVRASFGFRLPFFGPFAIADMAGLDVYEGAYAALEEGLGSRLAAPEGVTERVARGELGTKTGGGFLRLDAHDAERMIAWRDAAYVALSELLRARGSWSEGG